MTVAQRDTVSRTLQRLLPYLPAVLSGVAGLVPIPDGWVQVTYFPRPGSDLASDYTAPILDETDTLIRIEVWGEPMTFLKRACIIRRSAVTE